MLSLSLDAAAAQQRANTCGLGTLAKLAGRSKCWRNPLPGIMYIIARVHILCCFSLCWHFVPTAIVSHHWLTCHCPSAIVLDQCHRPKGITPRCMLLEDGVKR